MDSNCEGKVLQITFNIRDPYVHQRKYNQNRYENDPEFRAAKTKRACENYKKRCEKDPEYKAKLAAKARLRRDAKKAAQ